MWYSSLINIPIDISNAYGEKTKQRRRLNKMKNEIIFQICFAKGLADALDRYKIEGIPDTMSERVILQSLLWHANVCFFKKEGLKFALPAYPAEELNINGDAGYAEAFALNGYTERVKLFIPGTDKTEFLKAATWDNKEPTGVLLWENKERYPFIDSIMYYASVIADTYRTLDVCRNNIKNPQIFYGDESLKETVERYLELRETNATAAFISTGVYEPDKLKILPFDPKGTTLTEVTSLIEWYENKLKERNGIKNNSQMDKKGENLIEEEVNITDESTNRNIESLVDYMNEQLEFINEFMELNLKVVSNKEVEDNGNSDKREDLRADGGSGADNISNND